MRFKKQKRHRRAVRFYTACFGFREPFKVLCDGTFVHHLLVNRITPADTALANILGGTVKVFTTRCILVELKSLGKSYTESLNAANSLSIARCDHEKRKSATDCMIDVIGEINPEHFFVATQDAELRRKFQEFARSAEEERSHMTELEYKMLKIKKRVPDEEEKYSSDANERKEDCIFGVQAFGPNVRKKRGDLKDKTQFKRKRAKGPNPLSCKKKTSPGNTRNPTSGKESQNGDATLRSRSRKRKRSHKSKNALEATV